MTEGHVRWKVATGGQGRLTNGDSEGVVHVQAVHDGLVDLLDGVGVVRVFVDLPLEVRHDPGVERRVDNADEVLGHLTLRHVGGSLGQQVTSDREDATVEVEVFGGGRRMTTEGVDDDGVELGDGPPLVAVQAGVELEHRLLEVVERDRRVVELRKRRPVAFDVGGGIHDSGLLPFLVDRDILLDEEPLGLAEVTTHAGPGSGQVPLWGAMLPTQRQR